MANNGKNALPLLLGAVAIGAGVFLWARSRGTGGGNGGGGIPGSCLAPDGKYYGDVNGDGVINQADLDMIEASGWRGQPVNPADPNNVRANVTGDGFIDLNDVDEITAFIAGRVTSFPVCTGAPSLVEAVGLPTFHLPDGTVVTAPTELIVPDMAQIQLHWDTTNRTNRNRNARYQMMKGNSNIGIANNGAYMVPIAQTVGYMATVGGINTALGVLILGPNAVTLQITDRGATDAITAIGTGVAFYNFTLTVV